jgi:hypothetical protein
LLDEKLKLAVVWLVIAGGFPVRVTTGWTVSIVHWKEATSLALPVAVNART